MNDGKPITVRSTTQMGHDQFRKMMGVDEKLLYAHFNQLPDTTIYKDFNADRK